MPTRSSCVGWLNIYPHHEYVEYVVFQQQKTYYISFVWYGGENGGGEGGEGEREGWKWKWEDKKFNGTPRLRLIKIQTTGASIFFQ